MRCQHLQAVQSHAIGKHLAAGCRLFDGLEHDRQEWSELVIAQAAIDLADFAASTSILILQPPRDRGAKFVVVNAIERLHSLQHLSKNYRGNKSLLHAARIIRRWFASNLLEQLGQYRHCRFSDGRQSRCGADAKPEIFMLKQTTKLRDCRGTVTSQLF